MPLISVIMSTKDTNNEYLKSSINSIIHQNFKDFEFIIIDDGSKEDYKVIESFKDDRIIIIKNSKTEGLANSLNKAINISKGKYIARMDSDDLSTLDRLQIQYDFMEKHPNIDICSTYTKYIGKKSGYNVEVYNSSEAIRTNLFLYNCMAHPSIFIRKKFIDKNNLKYNPNFSCSQDYELWNRISSYCNFYIIPKVCLFYRIHNAQISTSKLKQQTELCKIIYLENLKKLKIEKNADILFELSLKKINCYNVDKDDIKLLIKKNSENKIYNCKCFSRLIYFKYCYLKLIKKHQFVDIISFYKSHIFIYYIKKFIIIIRCQINLEFRRIKFRHLKKFGGII